MELCKYVFCVSLACVASIADDHQKIQQSRLAGNKGDYGSIAAWRDSREALIVDEVEELIAIQAVPSDIKKWLLLGQNASIFIGVGEDLIVLKHASNSTSPTSIKYDGPVTSAGVVYSPTARKSEYDIIVVVETSDGSQLLTYAVGNSTLAEIWREPLGFHIDAIAVWEDLILVSDGSVKQLLLYRKQPDGLCLQGSLPLPGRVADMVVVDEFVAVAVPSVGEVLVHRLSEGSKPITRLSVIKSRHVRSLAAFRLGMSHYLAVGGEDSGVWRLENDSGPYRLTANEEPVEAWLAIPLDTYRHDVLLLAETRDGVTVLTPDGFSEFRSEGDINMLCRSNNETCGEMGNVDLLKAASRLDTVLLPTRDGMVFWLRLNHRLEAVPDQMEVLVQELDDLQSSMLTILDEQDAEAEILLSQEINPMDVNATNVVSALWFIDTMNVNSAVFEEVNDTSGFEVDGWIFAGRKDWSEDDINIDLETLKQSLTQLLRDVHNLRDQLQDAMFTEESQVRDYLPSYVNTGFSVEGMVTVGQLQVENLNGYHTDTWLSDCFRSNRDMSLSGVKTAVSVKTNSLHFGSLDEIRSSDLVFAHSYADIQGDLILEADVTVTDSIDLPPEGTVNGLYLKDDLLLVDTPFMGEVSLDALVVNGDAQMVETSLDRDEPPTILPAHFSLEDVDPGSLQQARVDDVVVAHNLDVLYINGENVNTLLSGDVADVSEEKEELSLSSLSIQYLNGQKFPEAFVRASDKSPVLLGGEKNFAHLQVSDLRTSENSFLDLLMGDVFSEVEGKSAEHLEENGDRSENSSLVYIFRDLEVLRPLQAELVNNATWLDLKTLTEKTQETQRKSKKNIQTGRRRCRREISVSGEENNIVEDDDFDPLALIAEAVEIQGSVTTGTLVSGFSLSRYSRYLSKTKAQTIKTPSSAEMLTVMGNLTLTERLNPVSKQLGQHSQVERLAIFGDLKADIVSFMRPVEVEKIIVNGLLCGLEIEALHRDTVLRTDENVFLRGKKTFPQGLTVNNMNVHTMNGRRPTGVATCQGDHPFSGSIVLKGRILVKSDLLALGLVNGVNLTDLGLRVSTGFGAFVVPGDFLLAPHATIENLIVDGFIQSQNFTKLMGQVVFKGEDFEIDSANITFLQDVRILGDLTVSDTVNDVNVTELFNDMVLLNRTARLQHLVLSNNALIAHLDVEKKLTAPLVDGCDVNRWREDAISLDQDIFVPGVVKFSEARVHGDALVTLLNGGSTASLIPLKSAENIPGKLIVRQITAASSISVQHFVNGRHLPDVWKDSFRNNASQVVTGVKRFASDVEVDGEIDVEAVNGRHIADFVTLDTPQNVSSGLTWTGGVTLRSHLYSSGFLGGVNITEWTSRLLLPGTNQTIHGSWTITGNTTVHSNIEGSGLLLDKSLVNTSLAVADKIKRRNHLETQMWQDFQMQCERVLASAVATKNQLRVLEMFDDIQGLEFHTPIHTVIDYQAGDERFILVTFSGRCSAVVYRWNETESKFARQTRVKTGPIDAWTTLPTSEGSYVVVSGPRACQRTEPSGGVWKVMGANWTQVATLDAFSDVVADNVTVAGFHIVNRNGSVTTWSLVNGEIHRGVTTQMPRGHYKFVPFSLGLGLALWDGDRIVTVVGSNSNMAGNSRLPGASVAVSSDGLVALSDGVGRVELHRNLPHRELIDALHFSVPTHLYWVDLKAPGELYLVFASDHHKIQVFQYKGASGLVKRSALPYPSSSVSVLELPHGEDAPTPHLLIVYGRTLHLLHARAHGQPTLELDLQCSSNSYLPYNV